MSVRRCLACMLVLTALSTAAGQPQPDPADAERLVKLLGSPRFVERESALKALEALGPAAVPALRRAAQSRDPEVARRISELLAKHERQADADAAFAPTKVRIRANGTSLGGVLQTLVQQSRVQIRLAREPVDLADRPVTLQTGEISFWEALDALCRAAKLSVQSGEYYPGMPENSQIIPTSVLYGLNGSGPALVLQDGVTPTYPTAVLGAVRVRLIPERWDNRGRGPNDELRWMLEMLSEAHVQWYGPPAFHFEPPAGVTANRSPQVPDNFSRYRVQAVPARNGPTTAYLIGSATPAIAGVLRYEYPVYVQFTGPAAGKTLPELKGSLSGTALLSSQVLVAIDGVSQAGAPAAAALDGTKLTVQNYRRADDGSVTLKLEIVRPLAVNRTGRPRNALSSFAGTGRLPSLPAGNATVVLNYLLDDHGCSLRLFDERDRPYQVTVLRDSIAIVQQGDDMAVTLTVDARQAGTPGQPRRLELIGPRLAPVEAKFTLRDLPRP